MKYMYNNPRLDLVNTNVLKNLVEFCSFILKILSGNKIELELMFMKHYAPNRCLYIKVAKLRTGVGSAEMSHLQNRCLKISG